MKRQVLNQKGMMLLLVILILSVIFGLFDCNNILLFIITKIISLLLISICFLMTKYIPKKYL